MTPPSARLLSPATLLTLLALLVMLATVLGLAYGAVPVPFLDTLVGLAKEFWVAPANDASMNQAILGLRLPRVLLGLLAGAALAISGTAMQGLFRNPLVEPGLVGMSSGAALAAVTVIVLGKSLALRLPGQFGPWVQGYWALPMASFLGAALTAWLVVAIVGADGRRQGPTLLLAGLAVNAISGGLIGLLSYVATDEALRAATFWMFGSLARATWTEIAIASPALIVAIILLPRGARALNALQLGEAAAGHLGIDVNRLRRMMLLGVLLAVGGSVALCGAIGFVGLIAPHAVRLLSGPDHRVVFPASGLAGAALLTLADLAARTLAIPADIPIGILTSLVGGPFFVMLLIRLRRTGELP